MCIRDRNKKDPDNKSRGSKANAIYKPHGVVLAANPSTAYMLQIQYITFKTKRQEKKSVTPEIMERKEGNAPGA